MTTNGNISSPECGSTFPHFATDSIHAGQDPDQWNSRAVVPPISLSTTFKQKAPAQLYGYDYSRSGNPTRDCFEKCFAAVETANHGLAFSSGLATTATIVNLLKTGDHIVSMNDVYGGTNRLPNKVVAGMGIETSFIDASDVEILSAALRPNTKLVWIETPTNPTLRLVDIQAVSNAAKTHNRDIIVVVDNTFLSPYFQRPLDLGADIVMHSVTKYINGHSDVVMGILGTRDDALAERLRFLQMAIGSVPSAFDCFLANRGLKTLAVRMKQHYASSRAVFDYLHGNERVVKVVYPAHSSHPQHELWKRQCKGYSGMITFFIKGGLEESKKFLSALKLFTLAESLGGYESLAEHPALMTHASVPAEMRETLGISDTLIRLSIGLEDVEDLIADIDQALKVAIPTV